VSGTGATLAAGGRCQVFVRLDTSLAGVADANPRVTEASSDARPHGFVIGGDTGDGDAEPGSRCKSDTVLATVTRELEPPVATGSTGREGRVRALDLGVRRPPASLCSAEPREMEGLCRPIVPAVIAGDAATTHGRGWRCVLLWTSDCLLSRGDDPSLHCQGGAHDRVHS
jgi:hypothetical protein